MGGKASEASGGHATRRRSSGRQGVIVPGPKRGTQHFAELATIWRMQHHTIDSPPHRNLSQTIYAFTLDLAQKPYRS
jgi:hypothetical protein